MSEQCRVKLTAGRVKNQGGVDGIADVIFIADVITSLFLKPTACRSPETRIANSVKYICVQKKRVSVCVSGKWPK